MGKIIARGMLSVCAIVGLLLGCNLPQVPPEKRDGKFPVDNAVTVRYLIPKSASVLENDGPTKGVKFRGRSYSSDRTYGIDTEIKGNIVVSRAERSQSSAIFRGQTISSFGEYTIDVATGESDGNTVVSLTPKTIYRYFHSAVPMRFTQEALRDEVLYKAYITVKYEFDSTYGADATLANFKRAGAEYKERGQDNKTELVLPLRKDGFQAWAKVEVWPYKNGSKAVLSCIIIGVADPATYTVDFGKAIPVIGKELERVTNG